MHEPKFIVSPATAEQPAEPPKEEGATMFCTQCGTRNTDDANFCQKCGRHIGRAPRALDDAEFGLLQQPEDRVGDLLAMAFSRREAGDIEGAIRACAGALQVLPESTTAHSLMGMLFEAQGERDKAITEFETPRPPLRLARSLRRRPDEPRFSIPPPARPLPPSWYFSLSSPSAPGP